MNVILLEKITHLGPLGTCVKVKPGFARNYLIPQGKALPDTESNRVYFEKARAELEQAASERFQEANQRKESLDGLTITIMAQASEEGRLFGSVGTSDIVRAIRERGVEVKKSEVRLPSGSIRVVGEYEIELYLHASEVVANVKISVLPAM